MEQLIEEAIQSKLFTAPVLGDDLERLLDTEGDRIRSLARRAVDEGVQQIYWVGSGNSWVNLYSGKYLLDRFVTLPSDLYTAYDFIGRNPKRLPKSWAFLASFSGGTEDTVAALRHANAHAAHTIALVSQADSLMGREAAETIAYNSKALYILPLAITYLFALEYARLQGAAKEVEPIIEGLYALPDLLRRQFVEQKELARQQAEQFKDERLLYTLASGPLWGLGYKFGLTVFMENLRVNGSFMDATEFRHGPVEMFDREKPAMVLLVGTDESRPIVERVRDLCAAHAGRLLVFDMADYPGVHPLLAPFALMIPLQWFAVWSALLRGITDLDERALMGRGILGRGQGVTWP